jgi:hypothetical protein
MTTEPRITPARDHLVLAFAGSGATVRRTRLLAS